MTRPEPIILVYIIILWRIIGNKFDESNAGIIGFCEHNKRIIRNLKWPNAINLSNINLIMHKNSNAASLVSSWIFIGMDESSEVNEQH